MAIVMFDVNAARSELKEYKESTTSELSTINVKVSGMEESMSTCMYDISILPKEVSHLTAITDMMKMWWFRGKVAEKQRQNIWSTGASKLLHILFRHCSSKLFSWKKRHGAAVGPSGA